MSITGLKEFVLAKSREEASQALAQYEESALILAGGTFIHGLAARGLLFGIEAIVDISRLPMANVSVSDEGIEIGANVRYLDLATSSPVVEDAHYGAFADALEYPPPQIMNAATIGGCVAASCPLFDLPVALAALNARVRSRGGNDESIAHPVDEFLVGLFENALEPGQIVESLDVPAANSNAASGFAKFETNANDLAIINAAVSVEMKNGVCDQARVVVGGGIGEKPVRAAAAERALVGNAIDDNAIAAAAADAKSEIETMSDQRTSAEFRSEMVRVMVAKAARRAFARLQ